MKSIAGRTPIKPIAIAQAPHVGGGACPEQLTKCTKLNKRHFNLVVKTSKQD